MQGAVDWLAMFHPGQARPGNSSVKTIATNGLTSLPVGGSENVMATLVLRLSGPDSGQYVPAVTILIGLFCPLCPITINRCRQPGQRTSMPFSKGFSVRSAII